MLKRLILISQFVVIMIVGGYVVYLISKGIPIPGIKFLLMGPFLTLVLMVLLEKYPKYGTLSLINVLFGMIMVIFTPWMTVAILAAGLLSDLINLLPFQHWSKRAVSLGCYNAISLLTSVYISNVVTGNALYGLLTPPVLFVMTLISFLTGSLGAVAGRWINGRYLKRV